MTAPLLDASTTSSR